MKVMEDWLTILGALGGLEAIKWVVNFYVNRKTDARKEDAAADAVENENERKQVAWLEARITQRDTKIDAIYVELRQEQAEKLQLIHDKHELELRLKESEIKKCDVRGCSNRQPPSDY
ncbi:hypothetical protein [Bacteroides ovatus]|uniref:hypothetical protein n=1 Tax=Bacteroides ovatus TaxID=28116 RepID=UPI000E42D693|nr:hypothetical protein [Bacteroides ovatus]RGP03389.1 hypothetical protein DXA80_20265 [Bacteroides ovatus]